MQMRARITKSISYICYDENGFCGYVWALLDEGLAVYVSELFVIPEQRNQHNGCSLITQIRQDFLPLTVYGVNSVKGDLLEIGCFRFLCAMMKGIR